MEAPSTDTQDKPPGESPMETPSTDMPSKPPGESAVEASAVMKKPKAKGKWLPLEIQFMIIHLLDTPSYVEQHLEDNPAEFFDLEGRPRGPEARRDLKNASLVCRAWHREVRPLLFRHLNLRFAPLTIPRNDDEQAIYKETVSFLWDQESFLFEVVESVTLCLVLPEYLQQQKQKLLSDFKEMGIEEYNNGLEALGTDNSFETDEPKSLIDGVETRLLELRPQRVTIMATGATMDVLLNNRCRYPITHCFIKSPRLQILSVSRREADPENDTDWEPHILASLLDLVDADDLIINDGSLLQVVFPDKSRPSWSYDPDLHEVLLNCLSFHHRHITLKSLSFISLFNFKRGLMPLSHQPYGVLRRRSELMESHMPGPDIYSHRILPRDHDLEGVLSLLFPSVLPRNAALGLEHDPDVKSAMAFFKTAKNLCTYEHLIQCEMDWAKAYQFHDLEVLSNSRQWITLANGIRQSSNDAGLLHGDTGWFVNRHCLTDLEWRDSEDDDKREVIEMMDGEGTEDEDDIDEDAVMAEVALMDAQMDAQWNEE